MENTRDAMTQNAYKAILASERATLAVVQGQATVVSTLLQRTVRECRARGTLILQPLCNKHPVNYGHSLFSVENAEYMVRSASCSAVGLSCAKQVIDSECPVDIKRVACTCHAMNQCSMDMDVSVHCDSSF